MVNNKIGQMLNIYEGEGFKVFYLFSLFFVVSFGSCLGLNACEAIFIKEFGINNLPIGFIMTAIMTILISFSMNALYSKFQLTSIIKIIYIFVLIMLAAHFILIKMHISIFIAGIFIFTYTFFMILRGLLLNISDKLNDIRQTKRLFPIFSSGAMLGTGTAGILTKKILLLIGNQAENLFLVWIIFLIFGMILSILSLKIFADNKKIKSSKKGSTNLIADLKENISYLKTSKLFFLMCIISFMTYFIVNHMDFLYMYKVKQNFPDTESITAIFGSVRGYSNLIAFVIQFFLTSQLINKYGTTNIFQIFPISFGICFILLIFQFTMPMAISGRLIYYITKEAFHFPSFQPFFNALSDKIKSKAVPFVNNILGSLGNLTAGLFLLIFLKSNLITPYQSLFIALICSIVMIFYAFFIKKEYIKSLLTNLKENSPQKLDMLESIKNLKEEDSEVYLISLLKGDDEELKIFALESLSSFKNISDENAILNLLDTETNPQITKRVFNCFYEKFHEKILSKIPIITEKHKKETKLYFLDYLDRYKKEINFNEHIYPFFSDKSLTIKIKCAILLYQCSDEKIKQEAETFLKEKLKTANEDDSIIIAQEFGNASDDYLLNMLLSLQSKFKSHKSQLILINALSQFKSEKAFDIVLPFILRFRTFCRFFIKNVKNYITDAETAALLIKCIEKNKQKYKKDSFEYMFLINLSSAITFKSKEVQQQIIDHLYQKEYTSDFQFSKFKIGEAFPEFTLQHNENITNKIKTIINEEIFQIKTDIWEIASFKEYDLQFSNIFYDEKMRLITRRIQFIFNLFAYLYKEKNIDVPLAGFFSPDKNVKASSLEAIENIIDKDIFKSILLILEEKHKEILEAMKEPVELKTILKKLILIDNYWLNSLGLYFSKILKVKTIKTMLKDYSNEFTFVSNLKTETYNSL